VGGGSKRRPPPPQASAGGGGGTGGRTTARTFVVFLPSLALSTFKTRKSEYLSLVQKQVQATGGKSDVVIAVTATAQQGKKGKAGYGVLVYTMVQYPASQVAAAKKLLAALKKGCGSWLRPVFGNGATCKAVYDG